MPTRKAYRKPALQEFDTVKALTEGGYIYFAAEDPVYYMSVV
ncbi:MAG: hypothetical protein WDZ49_08750 [Litorilinea sp.]